MPVDRKTSMFRPFQSKWRVQLRALPRDPTKGLAALDLLRGAWATAGLDPNDDKTRVHVDPEAFSTDLAHDRSPAGGVSLR
jgi:hypothetical protein